MIKLQNRIEAGSAVVGVIGLGYVGLPLLRLFFDCGFHVHGFDIDPAKIQKIRKGENYIKHLGENYVRDMLDSGRFDVTDDFHRLTEADAILICVPTPLGNHLEPDLSFVENTADAIASALRPGQLIVLESTTYPGTTREVILPRLKSTGHKCGEDFFLAYSPEREDPGRKGQHATTIPKLVGGIDKPSSRIAATLYGKVVNKIIPVSCVEVAEMAKRLENIYRAVNIALVNEMKVVLSAMDIDVWEVVEAAATKPFGFQPFYPGPGLGGHCIPIDPFYLTWKAREVGQPTQFIELAGKINRAMPDYVINRTEQALNHRGKAIHDSRILVLGLAYKPNIDDVRESPSFELIEKLKSLGADVQYNDPHIPVTHKMRQYDLKLQSVPLLPQTLAHYDCILIATNHNAYDWQLIANHAKPIVDTRNATKNVVGDRNHIVNA